MEVTKPLKGPTDEDVRKLHTEIAQIVNQRFLITIFAITVFGVIGGWLVPKDTPPVGSDLGAFAFIGSILLTSLLFTLYLFTHFLRGILRTFTSYLLVTGKSSWEYDWEVYRQDKYLAYTKAQTIVFLVLGFFSTIFPIILATVYSLNLTPQIGLWTDIAAGIAYFLFVLAMGFFGLCDPEPSAMERWKEIKGS